MMLASRWCGGLKDRLPQVRGRLREGVPLAPITWFRVGGAAEVMFRPADEADLASFLAQTPADVPILVMGVGSNLLVRDGGVPGVVVRLGAPFAAIEVMGDSITAGAAALDLNVALTARNHGLAGLEFLSGIPGTIGGALRMNAGAYGQELSEVLVAARAVDRSGRVHEVPARDLRLGYRHCGAPSDWVFVSARLRGTVSDPITIGNTIEAIRRTREHTQPVRARTGGSTFANPPGAKAWELIERAGCRGLRLGEAQVSDQHCNFLINRGGATAAEIEALGETVRRRVLESSGVALRWEIKRIGVPLTTEPSDPEGGTP